MNHDDLIRYFQHEIALLSSPGPKFGLPTSRLAQSQEINRAIGSALLRYNLTEAEAEGLMSLNAVNIENFSRQVNN